MVNNSRGFTLVEVLVSVLILAIVSAMTAVSIQRSLRTKAKIEKDMSQFASVRDALAIMTTDINKAFHWVDINDYVIQSASGNQQQGGQQAFQNAAGPTPVPAELITAFIGSEDRIDFTTLSHVRILKDAPESDQAEVGYFTKQVKSTISNENTNALIRRISPILDGEVDKGGEETVLLEDVKELKFRFLGDDGGDKKDWRDSWRSERPDEAVTYKKFPDAVEITLSAGKDDRLVNMTTVAILEMPNNQPLPTPAPEQPGNQQGGGNAN